MSKREQNIFALFMITDQNDKPAKFMDAYSVEIADQIQAKLSEELARRSIIAYSRFEVVKRIHAQEDIKASWFYNHKTMNSDEDIIEGKCTHYAK